MRNAFKNAGHTARNKTKVNISVRQIALVVVAEHETGDTLPVFQEVRRYSLAYVNTLGF
jgi:hypothetical protein